MTALSPTPDPVPGTVAYIGIGGNLGDARSTVLAALDALASLPQVTELARSSLYGSAPVDAGGADYFNAVAAIRTGLSALELLQAMQSIEAAAGRERPYRNAPRTLDLDILLFGDALIHTERLQVPHPRMFERAFVLVPLAEIAPALVSETQLESVRGQGIWRL
jgi:2-amino-4-hydroxy-6-hydroxymethyldihydropteridine diphosphokinase